MSTSSPTVTGFALGGSTTPASTAPAPMWLRFPTDAPSGTAKLILRQIDPEGLYAPVYGRSGRIGARGREIGVHAVRGGTAAGEHSLRFFGRMEELELRHRADSREIFAQGALRAAAFAQKAEPGLYDMEDVLFGGDGWTRS